MYESVIEVEIREVAQRAMREFEDDCEKELLKSAKEIGVKVNKEELIKALNYDRDQYNKGYEDGKKEFRAFMEWLKKEIDNYMEEGV